jgi:tetratricopeptide (TPR) repeat protein
MAEPRIDPDATVTSLGANPFASNAPTISVPPRRRLRWVILISLGAAAVAAAAGAAIPVVRQRVETWLGIPTMPKQRQLAVLAFQAVDGNAEDASFSAGLTDSVTTQLAEIADGRTLQVVPARDLHERNVTTPEQARQDFGANLALEASLYRSGDQVRVNYKLVEARTRRPLSARSMTVPAADPFAVQDQIVDGAAEMLQIPAAQRGTPEPHGTKIPAAYMLYLRARGDIENYDRPDSIDAAIALFRQALQLDPVYAAAYAGLGDAYWKKYLHTKDARLIQSTRAPCEQALHLDEKLAAAYECLGTIEAGTGHYEEAAEQFSRALASEPTNEDAYAGLARAYELLGRPADAERTYQRAIEVRPQYWAAYNSLGTFYFRQNEYAKAADTFGKVVSLAPDSFHGYDNLGAAYLGEGEYVQAIATFRHSLALRPTAYAYSNIGTGFFYLHQFDDAARNYEESLKLADDDFEVWWNLGEADYWSPAKKTEAGRAFRQCVSLGSAQLNIDPRNLETMGVLAVCHAMLDDPKQALDLLHRAYTLGPVDSELSFKAALVYTQLHDDDQAVERLSEALAAGYPAKLARDTPMFDQLRNNPKAQQLLGAQ